MSTFKLNPLTGNLDVIYVPPFLIGTNSLPADVSLILQSNQQMIVLGDFNISGTLFIQGEMLVL